jgi:hypothetical protein
MKMIDDKVNVCLLTAFGEEYSEEFKTRFTLCHSSSSSSSDVSFLIKPITIDDL